MDPSSVAQEFVKYYYSVFDSDRSQLSGLYQEQSMLTFEGSQFQGQQAISEKLVSLPFQKVAHRTSTIDVQPSASPGSMIVFVTGELMVDEETNPMRFSQVFQLVQANSSLFVFNDIFRLNYS